MRFRQALNAAYGDRVERVVLFGSRARGDSHPDSDYDVAVFLRQPGELWDELGDLSHITTAILNDTGVVISAKPFRAGRTTSGHRSCMKSVPTGMMCDTGGGTLSRQGPPVPR